MEEKNQNKNKYTAKIKKQTGFRSKAKIRNFSITIDEPEKIGGTDQGPTPVEVLLGSLGGCLDFTGTIVAKEMGHELKEFELEIEGKIDSRGVMGDEDVFPGFQDILVTVKKVKGVPENKIPEFLKKVKNRCPVDNTIEKSIPITMRQENE